MGNNLLRKLRYEELAADKKKEDAKKEVQEIRERIARDKEAGAADMDFSESMKRHLRFARRVVAAGNHIGSTVDRLPIAQKEYHQKNSRVPQEVKFEAPLVKLVELYGVDGAVEHFSLGQHQKYQKVTRRGRVEFWNIKTGKREYPI